MNPVDDWQNRAACRGTVTSPDTDLFFADNAAARRAALLTCQSCPVQPDCLDWAIRTGQRHGVWGGRTECQLRRLVARDRRGHAIHTGSHQNTRKTHCSHGHAFNTENTYYTPGGRRCRTCRREAWRRSQQRRRARVQDMGERA